MPRPKRQKTSDTAMSESSSNHPWADLPAQLSGAIEKANKAAQSDGQLSAFIRSDAITESATFGIKGAGSDNAILTTVSKGGKISIRTGTTTDAEFTLSALPEQWQEFFQADSCHAVSELLGHVWNEYQAGRH